MGKAFHALPLGRERGGVFVHTVMTYQETITYLFESAPLFQQVGAGAYKEGLATTHALDEHLGHPHTRFRTLHVAGTNGKGSCSHTLAAILQSAGYKVGLYTSPHLVDFRERIRVNGEPVTEEYVIRFVEEHRAFFEPLHPSFFELATAMAFNYFAEQQVDVAVIEVGLGGRLDCTNIIRPDLCIITNISPDHTQFLGSTPAAIAGEKAGIIKRGVPVVIGEQTEETHPVFLRKAEAEAAPLTFADEEPLVLSSSATDEGGRTYTTLPYGTLTGDLGGLYQEKNTNTVLHALSRLTELGYTLPEEAVRKGFARVCALTGLQGRWQRLGSHPAIVCDAGHNVGGIAYVTEQLRRQTFRRLHIVFGMVSDKDIRAVLALLPTDATYYFTRASVKRAMDAEALRDLAATFGIHGTCHPSVSAALQAAREAATEEDFIFIGGSCFIVADLLTTARG